MVAEGSGPKRAQRDADGSLCARLVRRCTDSPERRAYKVCTAMLRSRIPAAARAALQARRIAAAPLVAAPRAAAPAPLRLPALARSVQTSAVGTKLVKDNGDTIVIAHQKEHFDAYRCDPPALEQEVSKAELVEIYRDAVQMRRMEMACDQVCTRRTCRRRRKRELAR